MPASCSVTRIGDALAPGPSCTRSTAGTATREELDADPAASPTGATRPSPGSTPPHAAAAGEPRVSAHSSTAPAADLNPRCPRAGTARRRCSPPRRNASSAASGSASAARRSCRARRLPRPGRPRGEHPPGAQPRGQAARLLQRLPPPRLAPVPRGRRRHAPPLSGGIAAGRITCPYHQWTYDFDGRLVAAPYLTSEPGFDKSLFSLYPVGLETWGGFVFLNLTPPRPHPAAADHAASPSASRAIRWASCTSATPSATRSRRTGR